MRPTYRNCTPHRSAAFSCCVAGGIGWLAARSSRSPALTRPKTSPVMMGDSLPPSSDARMRLLESAVVHARDAVAILDAKSGDKPERSVLYVNEAFCKLTGYTREEIVGRSLHILRGPDSDPDTLNKLREAMDEDKPLPRGTPQLPQERNAVLGRSQRGAGPDTKGHISHWLLIQRDIDRRKAAERRAKQTGLLLRAIIDAFPGPIERKTVTAVTWY